ncbi:response regulator transcription factor [uncultured Microscilla sp.]|uniref:response regulator n=1 Tax=uncultured Microscilla sp. TaxID=432653 RepID=UPI0026155237|nr:response regulator transcription factor [uncultured Microscilla sp.]
MKTKVAIIEDNNMMRYMLKSYLDAHFTVIDFSNGLEFFAWLEQNEAPEIIVTDLEMPEMNGFELTTNIKNSQLYQHINIIILSGLDDSNDRIKCLEMGASDYLMKPFNPKELFIKICKTIQNNSSNEKTSPAIY